MNITINGKEFMTVCIKHKEAYWEWCPVCFSEYDEECCYELYPPYPTSTQQAN